jgi:hypothetical protein
VNLSMLRGWRQLLVPAGADFKQPPGTLDGRLTHNG